ncbi:MAG TPA: DUF4159 domain-containing protein [Polyangiaceae bacterium]|nr:DUF4159 domain-containing protein [Polyangiaceae bacterium]
MADSGHRLSRRAWLAALAGLAAAPRALAFGQDGAFHPRMLLVGKRALDPRRSTGPVRWSWELIRRTSAPGRLTVGTVTADSAQLLEEPFTVWFGADAVEPLSEPEIRGLRLYLALGGVLFVDDSSPDVGAFGRSVRRELARVLPESPVVHLPSQHVLYTSYYLLDRPVGRVEGPSYIEAINTGKLASVLFSAHDLLGALAQERGGGWALPVEPGSQEQRELAVRFAINLAMYVLCLDYKDDQVHAEELMRRRGRHR